MNMNNQPKAKLLSAKESGVIVKSSVWQAVKRLSVLACQSLPHHLQI